MDMQRKTLYAKDNRPADLSRQGDHVDLPFLMLVLILLVLGLVMLYSASYAQSTIRAIKALSAISRNRRSAPESGWPRSGFSAGYPSSSGFGWPGRCTP